VTEIFTFNDVSVAIFLFAGAAGIPAPWKSELGRTAVMAAFLYLFWKLLSRCGTEKRIIVRHLVFPDLSTISLVISRFRPKLPELNGLGHQA
jgi:hypothetical protein